MEVFFKALPPFYVKKGSYGIRFMCIVCISRFPPFFNQKIERPVAEINAVGSARKLQRMLLKKISNNYLSLTFTYKCVYRGSFGDLKEHFHGSAHPHAMRLHIQLYCL